MERVRQMDLQGMVICCFVILESKQLPNKSLQDKKSLNLDRSRAEEPQCSTIPPQSLPRYQCDNAFGTLILQEEVLWLCFLHVSL